MGARRTAASSGEDDLIARHFRPLATHAGALALEDDAAVVTPRAGCDLVLTKDAVVAGVHFFADDAPGLVARKALRVNLSDLAAKGAQPLGFLLALALPAQIGDDWLAAFAAGLGEDATAFGCPLLGGDTVRTTGPVVVSVTAFGEVATGRMVRRRGARPGDIIAVTGTIGDAALGLALRSDAEAAARWKLDAVARDHLQQRYLLPQPRGALAAALGAQASAGMDISDGLAGDLAKLCRVSAVTAQIDTAAIPFSAAARQVIAADPRALETALSGGDDYEILFTLPPDRWSEMQRAASLAGVAISAIGKIAAGEDAPVFTDRDGRPLTLTRLSFSHF